MYLERTTDNMSFKEIFKDCTYHNNEIAINIINVSKFFKIYKEKPATLYESIFKRDTEFNQYTALKNINAEIKKGEFVGIIGKNGCGKSTLLRIISNILRPSEGFVEINGTIASILELGIGFNQELTAKENIKIYASLMQIPNEQIEKTIYEIITFAELEAFKNTKVKKFSSGMYARLAFATAIQVEPDILLVDEVLAVGDLKFQQKCFNVFSEFKQKQKTIVFVSHDLNSIRRFCDQVLLLENGAQIDFGNTNEIINKYMHKITEAETSLSNKDSAKITNDVQIVKDIGISSVEFLDEGGIRKTLFETSDCMKIRILYESHRTIADPVFGIIIHDEKGNWIIGMNTDIPDIKIKNLRGNGYIDIIIPHLPLNKGGYLVSVAIAEKNSSVSYDYKDKRYVFNVVNALDDYGTFIPEYTWQLDGIIQDDQ